MLTIPSESPVSMHQTPMLETFVKFTRELNVVSNAVNDHFWDFLLFDELRTHPIPRLFVKFVHRTAGSAERLWCNTTGSEIRIKNATVVYLKWMNLYLKILSGLFNNCTSTYVQLFEDIYTVYSYQEPSLQKFNDRTLISNLPRSSSFRIS